MLSFAARLSTPPTGTCAHLLGCVAHSRCLRQAGLLADTTKSALAAVHTPNTAAIMKEAEELLLQPEGSASARSRGEDDGTAAAASVPATDDGGLAESESTETFLDDVESFLNS